MSYSDDYVLDLIDENKANAAEIIRLEGLLDFFTKKACDVDSKIKLIEELEATAESDRRLSLDNLYKFWTEEEIKRRYLTEIGQHEALDRTFIAADGFEGNICEHPFILLDLELYKKAVVISGLLYELYNNIGKQDFSVEKSTE